MYLISQRLGRLFAALLDSQVPLSVTQLASMLNVSRRTIFRELKDVNHLLTQYHLTLETNVGEGIHLVGSDYNKAEFARIIHAQEDTLGVDKEERRIALALALLSNLRWQKLLYYADLLGVSEATVSLDLDVIETELQEFQVSILRKKGLGILVCGQEMQLRRAALNYLMKANEAQGKSVLQLGFLSLDIQEGVTSLLHDLSLFLDWMTQDAKELMGYQMMVQVSRLQQQLELEEESAHNESALYMEMARRVASELSIRFDIDFSNEELYYLASGLRGARTKAGVPYDDQEDNSLGQMQGLAYRMIERFNPQLAPLLKTNEELVRGLSIHLWSAVTRIQQNVKIKDPLSGEIQREYPEIYHQTKCAVEVLQEELQHPIPEGEIACIATHFGAAMMQVGQHRLRRRLKVGIICMGGIGVSYMMEGQIKKEFGGHITTEIGEYNKPEEWGKHDFLVSTAPLQGIHKPVVVANPVLTPDNYEEIRLLITQLKEAAQSEEHQEGGELLHQVQEATGHLKELEGLLHSFTTISFSADQSVEELSKFAGYRFANTTLMGEQIYNDLMAREAMSTQIISPLNLLLLHCITAGVNHPVFALIHMSNDSVIGTGDDAVTSGIVVLAPKDGSPMLKNAIGTISGALIEDEGFLSAIHQGNSTEVYQKIQTMLSVHLSRYFSTTFHG